MIEILKALLAGVLCGAVFSLVKLPIPAPSVFAGIAGVIGIWLGYILIAKM